MFCLLGGGGIRGGQIVGSTDSKGYRPLTRAVRPEHIHATIYTAIVCGTCIWVLLTNKNRYQRSKKKGGLSKYQRSKFACILIVQFVAFYLFPYLIPGIRQEGGFFNDPAKVSSKAGIRGRPWR